MCRKSGHDCAGYKQRQKEGKEEKGDIKSTTYGYKKQRRSWRKSVRERRIIRPEGTKKKRAIDRLDTQT